jgi:tRNA(Ile)-lysidine synthase
LRLDAEASLPARFAESMDRLGPCGKTPFLAVAVSGGADSMALALLAQTWVSTRGGRVLALIIDHGLRPQSSDEAALTAQRLAAQGIEAQIQRLTSLTKGPALQERARDARHQALAAAARAAGALFLLLGHHQADQAETVAMRAARGKHGLEGMAGWAARHDILLLRPLIGESPAALRAWLRSRGQDWVEDPSNADESYERVRIRLSGTGRPPENPATRRAAEHETAAFLAAHAVLRPEGFAILRAAAAPPRALGALLRAIAGAAYAPDAAATAALAANLRPASLGGVILTRTAAYGGSWLLAREPAACSPPISAAAGAVWDNRFILEAGEPGAQCGALGPDAAAHRRSRDLPSLVLRGLPCLRTPGGITFPIAATFRPPAPIAPHPFFA